MLSFAAPSWHTGILAPQNPRSSLLASGKARLPSLIVPRLYLSDYLTAHNEKDLVRLNISHVVSVLDRVPSIPGHIPEDRKLHISVADRSDVDISQYLTQTTAFIAAALAESEDNNVLVHCFQGVSRSATVVCAYLVATTSMSSSESIGYVQGKRPIVCPNLGFRRQLQAWSAQNYGESMKRGRVGKFTSSFAETFRELKAIAGAQPSTAKLKPRATTS
ncbi:protein-tyrosine phosphatase-like protein [Mycena amicta]|nr:protein-tyrosine phosphatase-like protein [Mycena amicta]